MGLRDADYAQDLTSETRCDFRQAGARIAILILHTTCQIPGFEKDQSVRAVSVRSTLVKVLKCFGLFDAFMSNPDKVVSRLSAIESEPKLYALHALCKGYDKQKAKGNTTELAIIPFLAQGIVCGIVAELDACGALRPPIILKVCEKFGLDIPTYEGAS